MTVPLSPAYKGRVHCLCCFYRESTHCRLLLGAYKDRDPWLGWFLLLRQCPEECRGVVVLPAAHLEGEFLQVSQQTLVGETERLHLVSIGLYSLDLSARDKVIMVELVEGGCPSTLFIERRFGLAPLGLRSRPMYMSFSAPSISNISIKSKY